jgi:hypothetical protein
VLIFNIWYKLLQHFAFIEFEHQEYVDKILSVSTHINYEQIIPVYSSNLWFRNLNRPQNNIIFNESKIRFCKYSCKLLQDSDIIKILSNISTVDRIFLFIIL